jgi:hypothetical protein
VPGSRADLVLTNFFERAEKAAQRLDAGITGKKWEIAARHDAKGATLALPALKRVARRMARGLLELKSLDAYAD